MCSTPEGADGKGFYPQRDYCFATRTRIMAERAFARRWEKAEPTRENGWLTRLDGASFWAATEDLSPDDDFDGAFDAPKPPEGFPFRND